MRIVRRASKIFGTNEVITTCFRAYVLSRLEYCAPARGSAAKSYFKLLDWVVRGAEVLCGVGLCNLVHRRQVSCLCMICKIYNNPNHALRDTLFHMQYDRLPRGVAHAHEHQLRPHEFKTEQFNCCFVPSMIRSWNTLSGDVFNRLSLQYFKEAVNRN